MKNRAVRDRPQLAYPLVPFLGCSNLARRSLKYGYKRPRNKNIPNDAHQNSCVTSGYSVHYQWTSTVTWTMLVIRREHISVTLIKKKENLPHIKYKEIQKGSFAKPYMTNGLLIYE